MPEACVVHHPSACVPYTCVRQRKRVISTSRATTKKKAVLISCRSHRIIFDLIFSPATYQHCNVFIEYHQMEMKMWKKRQRICQRQIMLLYINFLTFLRHHGHQKNFNLCLVPIQSKGKCCSLFFFYLLLNNQRPVWILLWPSWLSHVLVDCWKGELRVNGQQHRWYAQQTMCVCVHMLLVIALWHIYFNHQYVWSSLSFLNFLYPAFSSVRKLMQFI